MTDKQPEALRLADALEFSGRYASEAETVAAVRRIERNKKAAAELRRLHEVNAELLEALTTIQHATSCVYSRNIAESAITKATGEQQ